MLSHAGLGLMRDLSPIDGPESGGITNTNITMLKGDLLKEHRETTLSHEFVHFLSGSGVVKVGDHDGERSGRGRALTSMFLAQRRPSPPE
jgi:hypothetical protein